MNKDDLVWYHSVNPPQPDGQQCFKAWGYYDPISWLNDEQKARWQRIHKEINMKKDYTLECPECGNSIKHTHNYAVCPKCGNPRMFDTNAAALKELVKNVIEPLYATLRQQGLRPEDCRIRTAEFEIQVYSEGDAFIKERY